ncbi:MgtC/SapB family protein [Bacillus sp. AFS073361]|uniref:MgtC/SapB family protein n=1 Tax=Bacillus sp. AFS073361 TaxID=2033511 RepID=UPI00211D583B|nr:MgtC/SapB family protein [Bacillus sp. AFS073361]
MDDFLTMLLRLVIATVLSGLVGFEREKKKREAGLRTHVLVGIGSCSMMLFSIYGIPETIQNDNYKMDPARIPAYVISGIGFMGALLKGLTTAASLWVVTAIGLIVGVGMILFSIAVTVITLLSLWLLKKLANKIES